MSIVLNEEEINRIFSFEEYIPYLKARLKESVISPERIVFPISPGLNDNKMFVMPASDGHRYAIVKQLIHHSGINEEANAGFTGYCLLFDISTGELLSIMDAQRMTVLRTVSNSVLAASYLSPDKPEQILVIGNGQIARKLCIAYNETFPDADIHIWGRNAARVEEARLELRKSGIHPFQASDLESAVRNADIVSCATASKAPLLLNDWLSSGTHVDLIGSYSPDMREVDTETIRLNSIFTDTRSEKTLLSGDLFHPIEEGAWDAEKIQADLSELCLGKHPGRKSGEEITVFKAVGSAVFDLHCASWLFTQWLNASMQDDSSLF